MKTERCILHRGDIKRDLVINDKSILTKSELDELIKYLGYGLEENYTARVISSRNHLNVGDGINAFINKIIILGGKYGSGHEDEVIILFYNNSHELLKCSLSDNIYLRYIVASLDMEVFVSSTGVLFIHDFENIFATLDLSSGSFYSIKDITKNENKVIDRIDEVDGQLYLYYDDEYSDEDISKISINTVFNLWNGNSAKLELKFSNDGIDQIRVCDKSEQINVKLARINREISSLQVASKNFLQKIKLELLKSYKKVKSITINEIYRYLATGNEYVSDNLNGYLKYIYSITGRYKLSHSWFGDFSFTVVEDRFGNIHIGKMNEPLINRNNSVIVSNEGIICIYNTYNVDFTLDGRIVCKCRFEDYIKDIEHDEYNMFNIVLRDDGLYCTSSKEEYKIEFSFDFFNIHSQIVIPKFKQVKKEYNQ